ncbi:MAG: hypothetical protein JO360_07800 [Acidobacteria bacterium]|nr:hypothetical protein [Acidobacteriota bacterium]
MSEEERGCKEEAPVKDVVRASLYGPRTRRSPSRLIMMRRRLLFGMVVWFISLMFVGALFGGTRFSIVLTIYGIGGWLVGLGFWIRYIYHFAFKKDGPLRKQ